MQICLSAGIIETELFFQEFLCFDLLNFTLLYLHYLTLPYLPFIPSIHLSIHIPTPTHLHTNRQVGVTLLCQTYVGICSFEPVVET